MGKTLWNNQYRSKDNTVSPPEEKTEGTQQFKNHSSNKKGKTKVEKETQNTSCQQSSQRSRRQIHKSNFWYAAEIQ